MTERPADAACERQLVASHIPRFSHGVQQPLAEGWQLLLGVAQGGQYDGELVAREAGNHVAGAYFGTEHTGEAVQQGIPYMVPQLVVDLLEAIQIEKQQAERLPVMVCPLQLTAQAQGEGAG